MIPTNDLDLKMVEHVARVARVSRDAWIQEASGRTKVTHTWAISTAVASIRRRAGTAVVHAGYRLLPPNMQPGARS
jgi:hypothetical protein